MNDNEMITARLDAIEARLDAMTYREARYTCCAIRPLDADPLEAMDYACTRIIEHAGSHAAAVDGLILAVWDE